MSSGFVSGGTTDQPTKRDDDWLRAQQQIEANRRRKEEQGKQDGGKSLYEVLQQNKTAKQEAFEESIRLKNQFRSLDDDEVDFLDSILESTRAKEATVKKETAEQLEIFRKQREAAEKALSEEAGDLDAKKDGTKVSEESWISNYKKRRRTKEKGLTPEAKLRKLSSSANDVATDEPQLHSEMGKTDTPLERAVSNDSASPKDVDKHPSQITASAEPILASAPTKATIAPSGLGLGDYGSDDD